MVKTTLPGGAQTRHPRPGASLTARARLTHRMRRCAALTLAAGVALGGLGAVGVPALPGGDALVAAASAVEAPPTWYPNVGHGIVVKHRIGNQSSHWLGANAGPEGTLVWCIEWDTNAPDPSELKNPAQLAASDHRSDTNYRLAINPAQTYVLFSTYQDVDEDVSRAALSYLAHVNYDVGPYVADMMAHIEASYPSVVAKAAEYADWARKNTPQNVEIPAATAPNAVRTGYIDDISVTRDDGVPMAGIPVTVTLNGPAVFDATGTNTWTGRTSSEPVKLTWTSTGNGEVTYQATYKMPSNKMVKYGNDGSIQDEIGMGSGSDPYDENRPGEPFKVFYDFQPMAVSSVSEADSKVVAHDATSLSDVIHVGADENYTASPEWMYDGHGNRVPIVFEGTAYYVGDLPATTPGTVPDGAEVVGSTTLTATGPGDYTATITSDKPIDSQFVTWVWQVKKADQGEWESYVAADWSDQYGLADETTSVPEKVEVDSTVQSNVTKSGTYLVDNLYIDGFDDDHGDFEGGAGFKADVDDMTQALYFYPDGLEVTDANLAKATLVAEVTVPAKNGYVDRVGSNKFKMLDGEPEGTYVFVTNFPGDDRTEPYTSSVTDPNEQVKVDKELKIKTTATDKADGDKILTPDPKQKVTITDKVCPAEGTSLKVGKTYTLTATAMDKNTGEAILNEDGKPYTGTADFTPKTADECGMVDVTIPATALTGKKVVMFEDVKVDGKTVALHTDINDNDQTVDGPNPEIGTTLTDETDGDHKVNAGPVTLTDHVCPKNEDTFTVGATYKVAGTLMDRATGKPVTGKDGAEVTAETTFTPKAADECATVTFKFDTTDLAGHDVVAFEKAYDTDGNLWASHEDIDDEGQTVRVDTPPSLPKTGAAVGLLTIAALGLIGSGTALVARRRKTDGNDSDGDTTTGSGTADLEAALA